MSSAKNAASLPDFDDFASFLISEGVLTVSPAELHGLLAGQLAAGARLDTAALADSVSRLTDTQALSQVAIEALERLYQVTAAQLDAEDFSVRMLLPDDEVEMRLRVDALGGWCDGFLTGFGAAVSQRELSAQIQEVLRDIAEIAQISADELDSSEEEEGHLAEVSEYVRMAWLLIHSEYHQQAPSVSSDSAPTLH